MMHPMEQAEAEAQLRHRLVDGLLKTIPLRDAAVEQALRTVPRHRFLPQVPLERAYADDAIATHWEDGVAVSSASQPAIVAIMLQQLALQPGQRVLEIGAGTGYNAALLAELVGPTGHVTTVDIDGEVAAEAAEHLRAAGYPQVEVVAADGALGWPPNAPYDRIELTASASDIAQAWYDQLPEDGLLVLPLWLGMMDGSVALRKRGGVLRSESLSPCGFMRLRGSAAEEWQWVTLPGGRRLGGARAEALAGPVAALLTTRPRRRLWTEASPAFAQYLGLLGLDHVSLWPPPARLPTRRVRARTGVYAEGADGPSLSLFITSPFGPTSAHLRLLISFGGAAAESQLEREAARWQALHPQGMEHWQVTAYLRATTPAPPLAEHLLRLERRHAILDIDVHGADATSAAHDGQGAQTG